MFFSPLSLISFYNYSRAKRYTSLAYCKQWVQVYQTAGFSHPLCGGSGLWPLALRGLGDEEAQAREGAGQHRVTEGHCVEVTLGLLQLRMLHAPVLWRPELDYCSGIQAQSVFIRERAKIIQEGSGPLINLKHRMKRGGCCEGFFGGGGGGVFGTVLVFRKERTLWNNHESLAE